MQISQVFDWILDAASGALVVLKDLATSVPDFFVTTSGETTQLTFIGALVLAGIGAPLAWRFIKYLISLFKGIKIS